MEIAALVFFLAIFGGIALFAVLLFSFVLRGAGRRNTLRNFSGRSSYRTSGGFIPSGCSSMSSNESFLNHQSGQVANDSGVVSSDAGGSWDYVTESPAADCFDASSGDSSDSGSSSVGECSCSGGSSCSSGSSCGSSCGGGGGD